MLRGLFIWSAIAAVALFWVAGLRLFLAAEMSVRWKLTWSSLLVLVGIAVGYTLSLADLGTKFLWLLAILPILAAVDVLVLRAKRGFTYWIRACGFEVVTVFATAAISRVVWDHLGVAPLVGRALE
jgi:hypothetical protein